MTRQAVLALFRARLQNYPTRREAAKAMGIRECNISNMLAGRHLPSKALLDALGLVAVVDYRPRSEAPGAVEPAERKRKRLFRYGDWPVGKRGR